MTLHTHFSTTSIRHFGLLLPLAGLVLTGCPDLEDVLATGSSGDPGSTTESDESTDAAASTEDTEASGTSEEDGDLGESPDKSPPGYVEPPEDGDYLYIDIGALLELGFYDDEGALDLGLMALEDRFESDVWVAVVEPGCDGTYACIEVADFDHGYIFLGEEEGFCTGDVYYSLVGLMGGGEYCSGSMDVPAEVSLTGKKGGICATLAIAHSLVDELGVVSTEWEGVIDGTSWHPDFLKAIAEAGDQDDGANRSFADSETDQAHTAPWNEGYTIVEKSDGWEEAPSDGDTDDLEDWCKELIRLKHSHEDDCLLRFYGKSGHLMKINNVSYADGVCTINTVNTGRQDSNANDFRNVPRAPGSQTWAVSASVRPVMVGGTNTKAWNSFGFNRTTFRCFDEDPIRGKTSRKGPAWR